MASTASPTASNDDEEAEDNCDQKEVKEVFDEHEPFVWGLGCRDNRSLNFYVLDFVTQWSLVQKLDLGGRAEAGGYGSGHHKVLPKAVIISLNDDKIFAMGKELSSPNLENFLRTFHDSSREQEGQVQSEAAEAAEAGEAAAGEAMPADMGGLRQLKLSKAISEQPQQQTEQAASSKTKTTSIEEIHAGNFAERLMRSPRSKPGESIFLPLLSFITIALYMKTDLAKHLTCSWHQKNRNHEFTNSPIQSTTKCLLRWKSNA